MSQLFEIAGTEIGLEPFEDETLFSWCSRYHRLAVNGADQVTCMQLFGHPRIGAAHDLPARIDVLVARSNSALGTAKRIIQDRTVLPFYLPFKSREVAKQAISALRGEGIGHLKYQLGMLTSGMGAGHPLKACPLCVREDLARNGWSYWRRSQQLPGVWICLTHHEPLHVSQFKLDQTARFSWVLPTLAQCGKTGMLERLAIGSTQAAWITRLAEACCKVVACKAGEFDDVLRISQTFRLRLAEMGLTHAGGRVRWGGTRLHLKALADHLICVPGFAQQATEDLLQTQFARLLSGRALTHPLRYVAWIVAWFDDLEDFRRVYQSTARNPDGVVSGVVSVPTVTLYGITSDSRREAVLAKVREKALSLTAAAKQLGVAYTTVSAWAAKEQILSPRRPKKLDDGLWQHVVKMLQHGAGKDDVAKDCAISKVSVTRVLRTVPGLQDEWHRVRHEKRRSIARQAWNGLSELRSHMGVNELRRLEPAAYAWLHRNDRAWLKAELVCIGTPPASNHAAARSERADGRMADAIKRAAEALVLVSLPLSLEALKRSVPALGRAIHSPQRWPVTIRVLRATLATRGISGRSLNGLFEN